MILVCSSYSLTASNNSEEDSENENHCSESDLTDQKLKKMSMKTNGVKMTQRHAGVTAARLTVPDFVIDSDC